jgi:hypothetical protein
MKPIAVKTIWIAAALIALAAAYLLVSGSFERLIFSSGPQKPAAAPIANNKNPVAGRLEVSGGSGKAESVNPATGVTRAFFKPTHSSPSETLRLKIAVDEQNGELLLNGSLLVGSACSRLQIELQLEADDGRKLFHTLVLGNSGRTGERPLRSKRRLPPATTGLPATWRAHVASLHCLDP